MTTTQVSPCLILDEFNFEGEGGVNLVSAETLFCQVAEKKLNFSFLCIMQKEEMINRPLAMNSWQKIIPTKAYHAGHAKRDYSSLKGPKMPHASL